MRNSELKSKHKVKTAGRLLKKPPAPTKTLDKRTHRTNSPSAGGRGGRR